jgi:hypothetical protein
MAVGYSWKMSKKVLVSLRFSCTATRLRVSGRRAARQVAGWAGDGRAMTAGLARAGHWRSKTLAMNSALPNGVESASRCCLSRLFVAKRACGRTLSSAESCARAPRETRVPACGRSDERGGRSGPESHCGPCISQPLHSVPLQDRSPEQLLRGAQRRNVVLEGALLCVWVRIVKLKRCTRTGVARTHRSRRPGAQR